MDILYKQLLELNKEYVPTNELNSYLEEIKELSGRIGDCREKIKDLNNGCPLRGGVKSSSSHIQKVLSEKEKLETENSILFHDLSHENKIEKMDYKLSKNYGLDLIPQQNKNQEQESFEYKVF